MHHLSNRILTVAALGIVAGASYCLAHIGPESEHLT